MTDAELQEIEAELEASSAVKCWPSKPPTQAWFRAIDWIEEDEWAEAHGRLHRNDVLVSWPGGAPDVVCAIEWDTPICDADAKLIANSPRHLRRLLGHVRELKAENEELSRSVEFYKNRRDLL